MREKIQDEWSEIHYPTLTDKENDTIRNARRKGFASFYPNTDNGDQNTLRSAKEYLKNYNSEVITHYPYRKHKDFIY